MDEETEDSVVFPQADEFCKAFENADVRNSTGIQRGDLNTRLSHLCGDGPFVRETGDFHRDLIGSQSQRQFAHNGGGAANLQVGNEK